MTYRLEPDVTATPPEPEVTAKPVELEVAATPAEPDVTAVPPEPERPPRCSRKIRHSLKPPNPKCRLRKVRPSRKRRRHKPLRPPPLTKPRWRHRARRHRRQKKSPHQRATLPRQRPKQAGPPASAEADIASTKIATLGGPPVTIETSPPPVKTADAKHDKSAIKKRVEARRKARHRAAWRCGRASCSNRLSRRPTRSVNRLPRCGRR